MDPYTPLGLTVVVLLIYVKNASFVLQRVSESGILRQVGIVQDTTKFMTAVTTPEESESSNETIGFGTYGYRTYVLSALTLIYILNFVDRGLLAVVGPDLVPELGLSDTQFGLLTGFGFALLYTIVGIPLARYADAAHRV